MKTRLFFTILILISLISITYSACYFGSGWNCTGCPTTQESSSLATGVRNGGAGWAECVYDDGSKCECRCSTDGKVYCADISSSTAQVCHISSEDYRCTPVCECSGTSCNSNGNGTICDGCNWVTATATEVCDGEDNDCDGEIDEGVKTTYYQDADGDGFGNPNISTQACQTPQGYTQNNLDCDDTNPNIHPNATETCNAIDDDCDGQIDINPNQGLQCNKNQTTTCNTNCTFKERNSSDICGGTIPNNATINTPNNSITQREKYNGTNWEKIGYTTYTHNTTQNYCTYKCTTGYDYVQEQGCISNTTQTTCEGELPNNAKWNSGQENTYYYSNTNPNKQTHYSNTQEDCAFICENNYFWNETNCTSNTRETTCTGTLPQNAKWNTNQTYTQTYIDGNWKPPEKNSFFSYINKECSYSCAQQTQNCDLNKETYCGTGTQDCNQGHWGECYAGYNARICSQNQYCSNNDCLFCEEGTKNCDLNLLNGCETNTLTDKNNCGTCGITCESECINGICSENTDVNVPIVDLCENVSCNNNEVCYSGSCYCETGYYNCDQNNLNGCETNTPCNEENECEKNSDCLNEEYCNNGNCEIKNTDICETSSDCSEEKYCRDGQCTLLNCGENFTIENNACVCEGTSCGNNCYTESGKCCKDIWNEGINSCEFELEEINSIVLSANNLEAEELLEQANKSIRSGEVLKGSLQAQTAEIKAKISLGLINQSQEIIYEEILTAIEEEDYDDAEFLIEDIKETPKQEFPILIVIIILIIIGVVAFVYYNKNKINKENKEF